MNAQLTFERKLWTSLLMFGALLIGSLFIGGLEASALDTRVTEYSPSSYASQKGGTGSAATKHLMIISDHGTVPRTEIGLYWSSSKARTVSIEGGTGKLCHIYNAKKHNKNKKGWANTYLTVAFSAAGVGTIYYDIAGANICNNTVQNNGSDNLRGKANAGKGVLYANYTIPASHASSVDPETGLRKVKMTVYWNDGNENPYANTQFAQAGPKNGDQAFNFTVRAHGGWAANIETANGAVGNRNYNVSGKNSGEFGHIDQVFPFGLACKQADQSNAPVLVYDADNFKGQDYPLKFYVAKVNPANGALTALQKNEYVAGSTEGISVTASSGSKGGLDVDFSTGYPRFVPGWYENRGGSTTVKVKELKGNGTHYAVVVVGLRSGGAGGNNNFIDVGMPGDGIFGSYGFNCPPIVTPTVTPSINFDKTEVSPGESVKATATIRNGPAGGNATVTSSTVRLWYDDAPSTAYTGPAAGQQLIPPGGWAGGTGSYGPSGSRSSEYTATGNESFNFICASIDIIVAAPAKANPTRDSATCVQIKVKPYLKIYGGDIQAGFGPAAVGSACKTASARISSHNKGASGYAGAGSQFGAQAMDVITGFASAQRSLASVRQGTGLSFANTAGVGGDSYGGSFASTMACRDYTAGISATAPPYSGNPTVPINTDRVERVNGSSVFIGGTGIRYAGESNWASKNAIPSYKLVVTGGDIYIGKDVTQLDGLYVAQPNSAGVGGNIYTCASAVNVPLKPGIGTRGTCNKQLVVNGSFIAKKVHLLRTAGDVYGSDSDSLTSNNAAEVFRYGPEQWLGQPSAGLGKPQAITSLPPSL